MTSPLADEVLCRLIRAHGTPVSGQGLARTLGVTRAAVWKCVDALRHQGYAIESLPAQGYRLAGGTGLLRPGEIAARLDTRTFGQTARHFDHLDSTNREAERWAQDGGPEGALVLAEHQEGGRGRLGRTWHDNPGRSLLFSLLLRPSLPAATAPTITFAAAAALAQTLARWIPRTDVEIKWPNDVLVKQRKVAGILLEMRCEAQQVDYVILGVGINVLGAPTTLPEPIRDTGTTLEACATRAPTRIDVLCEFLGAFEPLYERLLTEGFASIQPVWQEWFRMQGRAVRVHTPAGVVEGAARGLGPSGALVLQSAAGKSRLVHAGDLETCTTRVQ